MEDEPELPDVSFLFLLLRSLLELELDPLLLVPWELEEPGVLFTLGDELLGEEVLGEVESGLVVLGLLGLDVVAPGVPGEVPGVVCPHVRVVKHAPRAGISRNAYLFFI